MPGGLIQLIAFGSQNILLNGNPSISFFKKVYKTHTNFSMESMRVSFNRAEISFNDETNLIAKISRNADLIQDIYFSIKIPTVLKRIVSEGGNIVGEDFRFCKNLGEVLINSYEIYIGGAKVDKQYGEWLHIWNELSIESSKRYGYDKLIGNIPELYLPDFNNNKIHNSIQIQERRLFIPLKFWFNRSPGLALPLIALQYHEVEIHILLKPLKDLYTVDGKKPLTPEPYFPMSLNIEPYLEVNYIYLDTYERQYFAIHAQDYLIEQIQQIQLTNINTNITEELVLQNPVKELIWVLKRNDNSHNNNWFEFTDYDYEEEEEVHECDTHICLCHHRDKEILKTATFLFNGIERLEDKEASYFNLVQPYQHHTVVPKEGIYVYSFSLNPEQYQPSGTCNMSRLKKIQLRLKRIETPKSASYGYDMTLYIVNYNFLRITGGLAGLAFSS
jgi:hypothetical protein